ncbi:MAG: adenylate/guanylate cyclase domain-containing protein [Fimbriimonadaceae bacterium]
MARRRLKSEATRAALQQIFIQTLLFSIPGTLFTPNSGPSRWWAVPSFTFGFSFWIAVVTLGLVPRMKRLPLVLFVIGAGVSYLAMILLAFSTSLPLYIWLTEGFPPWSPQTQSVLRGFLLTPAITPLLGGALLIAVLVAFMTQVSRLVGPAVMAQWVSGRYRSPREEERWFMFLDMQDSTSLAEQMGDLQFSQLVQEFLGDLSDPVVGSGGEVSHYIGDEAVLTWRVRGKDVGAQCLECFFHFRDVLEEKRATYESKYGLLPGFKAGVHCGNVVATQVGEIKSEIVYHGDVLNTAARVQGMCGELDARLLVTGEAWERVHDRTGLVARSRGEHILKGKAATVQIFEVTQGVVTPIEMSRTVTDDP